jgi:hypothetical protein
MVPIAWGAEGAAIGTVAREGGAEVTDTPGMRPGPINRGHRLAIRSNKTGNAFHGACAGEPLPG